MAYATDYALANNATVQQALQMALIVKARAVTKQAASGHVNADAKRQQLARLVLNNPPAMAQQFATYIAAGLGFVGTPTDAQLDAQIAIVWDDIAGVTAVDLAS